MCLTPPKHVALRVFHVLLKLQFFLYLFCRASLKKNMDEGKGIDAHLVELCFMLSLYNIF